MACALVVMFAASIAAPGLRLHNCRQFGTKSTQLCACCEAEIEAASGCCAKKSEPVEPACDQSALNSIESTCCFVSYEGPFSFDGQNSLQINAPASLQTGNLSAEFASPSVLSPILDPAVVVSKNATRHSSDPPSYILTHAFRC
jgi:hypothetical protein